MTKYSQIASSNVPQSQQAEPDQIKNRAGGYVFGIDKWQQLDRFLILGSEENTYYASAREMTLENSKGLRECLKEDGPRVVRRLVEISDSGRAPKNEPAIYALALAAADSNEATKREALAALPKVCRTSTHLFHWMADVTKLRGVGPAVRKAVSNWYNGKKADSVGYQAVKYQSRDGWSHHNILELTHVKAATPEHNSVFRWIVGGMEAFSHYRHRQYLKASPADLPQIVHGFELAKKASSTRELVRLIRDYKLPHECIPNEYKDKPEVWAALLPEMGITAILRNLGKMTNIGLLGIDWDSTGFVTEQLQNAEVIRKGRVHPMAILLAMTTYKSGHGFKGSLSWNPVSKVVDALDSGFYESFMTLEPTGKRYLLALDVSGSMGENINGTNINCRTAAAAMAMSIMRVEKNCHIIGFTNGKTTSHRFGYHAQGSDGVSPLDITPRRRLDDIVRYLGAMPFGGTDCALPFIYAREKGMDFDAVITFTDNETWAGSVHPHVALELYRKHNVKDCRFIACAFTATGYSVADAKDPLSMNCVGLDAALPTVVSDFCGGKF